MLPEIPIFTRLLAWVDPNYWRYLDFLSVLVGLVGLGPIESDPRMRGPARGVAALRRTVLSLLLIALLFPILVSMRMLPDEALHWWSGMLQRYWLGPVYGFALGLLLQFVLVRHAAAAWSRIAKALRVNQTDEKPSDIRDEMGRYRMADYDPRRHYQAGHIFLGLDERNRPYTISEEDFKARHMEIIGPSGSGKGVALGVILDQAVQRGWTVIAIDVKWGKGIPKLLHVIHQGCRRMKRTFVFLDLNDDGQGRWAPFVGGPINEAPARMVSMFNLMRTKDNSDVYKTEERAAVNALMRETDRTIPAMLEYLDAQEPERRPRNVYESLRELDLRTTFKPHTGRGFSVERSLNENAVVYVRGSLTDHLVKDATKAMIIECMQALVRLAPTLTAHVVLYIDEIGETLCEPIITAMRTLREFGVTVLIAYQGVSDLRTIKRTDVDGRNAEAAFHINCAHKLVYRAADAEIAIWAAEQTGTQFIETVRYERTEVNSAGAEAWENGRTIAPVEVPVVPENAFKAMPDRVGVVLAPGRLATIIRTAFVPITDEFRPKIKTPQSASPTLPAAIDMM